MLGAKSTFKKIYPAKISDDLFLVIYTNKILMTFRMPPDWMPGAGTLFATPSLSYDSHVKSKFVECFPLA